MASDTFVGSVRSRNERVFTVLQNLILRKTGALDYVHTA